MIRASLTAAAIAALLGAAGCGSSNMSSSSDGPRYVSTSGGGNGTMQQQRIQVDPATPAASEQPYALTGHDEQRNAPASTHGGNANWASLPAHN